MAPETIPPTREPSAHTDASTITYSGASSSLAHATIIRSVPMIPRIISRHIAKSRLRTGCRIRLRRRPAADAAPIPAPTPASASLPDAAPAATPPASTGAGPVTPARRRASANPTEPASASRASSSSDQRAPQYATTPAVRIGEKTNNSSCVVASAA